MQVVGPYPDGTPHWGQSLMRNIIRPIAWRGVRLNRRNPNSFSNSASARSISRVQYTQGINVGRGGDDFAAYLFRTCIFRGEHVVCRAGGRRIYRVSIEQPCNAEIEQLGYAFLSNQDVARFEHRYGRFFSVTPGTLALHCPWHCPSATSIKKPRSEIMAVTAAFHLLHRKITGDSENFRKAAECESAVDAFVAGGKGSRIGSGNVIFPTC